MRKTGITIAVDADYLFFWWDSKRRKVKWMQHRMRRASAFFFFLPLSGLHHLCFCLFFWLMQMGISFCKSVPCYCPLFFSLLHNFLPLHSRREGWQHELPCCSLCFFFFSFFTCALQRRLCIHRLPFFFFLGISTTFFQLEFSVLFPQPFFKASIMTKTTGWFLFFFFLFWS